MADGLRTDMADSLTALGRHWGWALLFGVITAVAGVVALSWPGETVVVIAVLFGIQLIVAGVFRFVAALAVDEESGLARTVFALLGVLSFIAGLYAVRHLFVTLAALALLLGIFWIVNGLAELFTALAYRNMPGRGWTALMGVISVAAGVVVLVYPDISLLTLTVVLGAWLVVFGVMEIILALQARSHVRTTQNVVAPV